jgi:predicted RNA-binding Zn ribbon-like protein
VFQNPDDPVALAVALVNTWDELEDPPELLRDVESVRRFVDGAEVASNDLPRVRALRASLRAAFEAGAEEAAVAALNGVLEESCARPQFERADGGWTLAWTGPPVDVLAATTAMSLLEAIRDDGRDRFGICAGAPCCCVFVDRSKNRSRRFCSDLCADRIAQAAHRARRRAAS